MQFELNVLEKSLETVFTHQNRTIPLFERLLLSIIIIFILPKSDTEEFFILRIVFVFLLILYYLIYHAGKSKELAIQDHFIGKLRGFPDQIILEKGDEQVIIDESFRGQLIFRYEGYHDEVIGNSKNRNIYYGTSNTISIRDEKGEQIFYIFLENKYNRKEFFELIDWTHRKKLNFKEFTRGERTYLDKKLTFKEIQEFKRKS